MLPSQAGAGNGAAALPRSSVMGMARTSSGRPGPGIPRGANGGGGAGIRGPGNGTGPPSGQGPVGGRFERDRDPGAAAAAASGSEGDSDSGEEEELVGDRRGVKRTLGDMDLGVVVGAEAAAAAGAVGGYGGVSGAVSGAKPGKKTRGRVKIKMEFIDNKLRRYTTFSKRKTGIMKKVASPRAAEGHGREGAREGGGRLSGGCPCRAKGCGAGTPGGRGTSPGRERCKAATSWDILVSPGASGGTQDWNARQVSWRRSSPQSSSSMLVPTPPSLLASAVLTCSAALSFVCLSTRVLEAPGTPRKGVAFARSAEPSRSRCRVPLSGLVP